MRILFVIDSLVAGGKERQMVELLKVLVEQTDYKCEVVIFAPKIEYVIVQTLGVPIHVIRRRFSKDPDAFRQLYQIAKKFDADILHCWEFMCCIYAIPVARMLGAGMVNGSIQNAPDRLPFFGKAWTRSRVTFPFSHAIHSNSRAGLRVYDVPEQKSYCIPQGFDFQRIEKIREREVVKKEFGITTQKVVGMVASFSSKKDYPVYINAAKQILSTRNDVTFLSIGGGETMEECVRMVPDSLKDRIRFLGRQGDVESIMNILDVGVLATFTEGLSNSIMEYMALGKPVVATDGGGTNELLVDGATGFLVKTSDVTDLSGRINTLLADARKAEAMGQAGKARIVAEFSFDRMRERFLAMYGDVIRRDGNSSESATISGPV